VTSKYLDYIVDQELSRKRSKMTQAERKFIEWLEQWREKNIAAKSAAAN
jgi:hypothetical protein